ncbi:MAG TPA: YfhO family protein [Thermoanaerobaculia bacterium]
MTTALLYFVTAAACVWLAHQCVTPMRRWVMVALVVLPLAFTGRALFTGRVYAPVDLAFANEPLSWNRRELHLDRLHNGLLSDVYCLNIPWKYAVRRAYSRGELALWNPSLYCGDILGAAAQPTPFEPLFLLSLLLPMATSLTYLAAMTFFYGALLMFLFLRELGRDELPSLVGAAIWTFSMFLVFWLEWVITSTLFWMPLVLLGVRRTLRDSAREERLTLRGPIILTIAFLMMLLNGHPESALHIVAIGLLWAAGELWVLRGRGLVRSAILGTGAGIAALLISAIYFLPIVEALPHTHEHWFREAYYAKIRKSVPLPTALSRLEAQLVPFVQGSPQSEWPQLLPYAPPPESGYCGSAALALAALGLWRSRARIKWVALALAIGGYLLGAETPPFADALGALPLFDIALNGRLVVAAALGISMLAALGVEALERRAAVITAIGTAAVLALAVANAWPRMREIGLPAEFLTRESAILIGAPLAAGAIALFGRSQKTAIALLLLVVAQRTVESGNLYPTLDAAVFYPKIDYFRHFPKSPEPYRIVGMEMTLIPNLATMYDLEDVRGYQAMTLRRMKETVPLWSIPQGVWFNRVDDLTSPFLSMMNVRFAVAPWVAHPPEGWTKVPGTERTQIFENGRVLPRAFVPKRVRVMESPAETLEQLKTAKDFGELSWIERRSSTSMELPNGPGTATTRVPHLGELHVEATMQRAGWVVISETAWNGWRATIDGQPAPIRYANHAFLGAYVPQGRHTLRLVYWPAAFTVGAWVSGVTMVGLVVVMVVIRRRRSEG